MKDLKLMLLTGVLNLFLHILKYLILFYNKIQEYVKDEISKDMENNNSKYSKFEVYRIILGTEKFPFWSSEEELDNQIAETKKWSDAQHRAFEEGDAENI